MASDKAITENTWDIVVIGGGPAGMMAAGHAAEQVVKNAGSETTTPPSKILIIEKNNTLGKKLLITGGGRCNLTNARTDDRAFLEKLGDDAKFLFSAFSQHGVKDTIDFFNDHSMPTKVEAENRVFPVSDSAQSVKDVLIQYMNAGNVTVLSSTAVTDFVLSEPGQIDGVKISNEKSNDGIIYGKRFILATGGKSHPETGSTGEGFDWLKKIGHTIIEPSAALVPVEVSDDWVKQLSGVSLPDAKVTIFHNGIKQSNGRRGKILFTHFGLSGPLILNMSAEIGELLPYGDVTLSLDLLPEHDYSTLNDALQKLFAKNHIKKIKNSIDELIPSAFISVALERASIDPDIFCNSVTRENRLALVKLLKDLTIHPTRLQSADRAIVTSGGAALTEIDFRTMQSKLVPNLYLVGDVLNIDRPSGGYSLQICWTTGFVAGNSAARLTLE